MWRAISLLLVLLGLAGYSLADTVNPTSQTAYQAFRGFTILVLAQRLMRHTQLLLAFIKPDLLLIIFLMAAVLIRVLLVVNGLLAIGVLLPK
jgi:hypothetical protein